MRVFALLAALVLFAGASAHAGSILTQGQLNTELGTSCGAQGKKPPCIGPPQMQDLITTAVPAVVAGITAAGSNQGGATALTAQVNDVGTVPVGTGVVLPTAVAGQQNTVCNDGVNSLLIYPASGASIGSNGTNSPVGANSGQCLTFMAIGPVSWRLISGNPGSTLAAGFYVSPSGSDSNPGTLSAPFQTLGHCQTAMQTGYKICYFRAGSYALPSGGLVLTTSDNGETFEYYPPDGVGSPILTTGSVAASTVGINTSCVGCVINGFTLNVSGNLASYIPIAISGNGTQLINNVLNGQAATSPYYMIDFNGATANANISGNTIENFGGGGNDGDAIYFAGALTNSVVANNKFQCINSYGIRDAAGGSNNNLIYGNSFVGGGHTGAAAPGCGSLSGGGGSDLNMGPSSGNLFANNTTSGNIGYSIVLNSPSGTNYVDNNTLQAPANPVITVDGSPSAGTLIRYNSLIGGSVGLNLGTEKDACPETSSAGLLVSHNTIATQYEPIFLSASVNSIIFDNKANIGTVTVRISGGPTSVSNHYAAGLSMSSKAFDETCSSPVYNTGNIIYNNQFTSANGNGGYSDTLANWGVYISSNGGGNTGNTISHNILYPFGNLGTLAYQPNGLSETATDNQTSASPLVVSATPTANAGPAQIAAGGQTLTLNGSATANFPGGGTAGVSYAWSCIVNCGGLTITSPTAATTTVTGLPSKATLNGATRVLVFQLVASNANGSSTDQVPVGLDPNL